MVRLILREAQTAHALALLVMVPIVVAVRRAPLTDSAAWTRWSGVALLLCRSPSTS